MKIKIIPMFNLVGEIWKYNIQYTHSDGQVILYQRFPDMVDNSIELEFQDEGEL